MEANEKRFIDYVLPYAMESEDPKMHSLIEDLINAEDGKHHEVFLQNLVNHQEELIKGHAEEIRARDHHEASRRVMKEAEVNAVFGIAMSSDNPLDQVFIEISNGTKFNDEQILEALKKSIANGAISPFDYNPIKSAIQSHLSPEAREEMANILEEHLEAYKAIESSELDKARKELSEQKSKITELESQLEEAQNSKNESLEKITELEQQLDSAKGAHREEIQKQMQELQKTKRIAEEEINRRGKDLGESIRRLNSARESIEALEKNNEALNKQLSEMREKESLMRRVYKKKSQLEKLLRPVDLTENIVEDETPKPPANDNAAAEEVSKAGEKSEGFLKKASEKIKNNKLKFGLGAAAMLGSVGALIAANQDKKRHNKFVQKLEANKDEFLDSLATIMPPANTNIPLAHTSTAAQLNSGALAAYQPVVFLGA